MGETWDPLWAEINPIEEGKLFTAIPPSNFEIYVVSVLCTPGNTSFDQIFPRQKRQKRQKRKRDRSDGVSYSDLTPR